MKKINDILFALFYSFRQSTKLLFPKNWEMSANLDPFYLFGPLYLFQNLKNKDKLLKVLICIIPLILYAIFQIIILDHINIIRLIINCTKIIICILTLLYLKDNWKKFSFYKIVEYSTILIFFVTIISLILSDNSNLWRFNDVINKYNETRLYGLFLEPSELGFHAMILIIFLMGYFLTTKSTDVKIKMIVFIILNCITLYFSRPFGAIVIGFIAIGVMFLYDFIKNFTKRKLLIYSILFILIVFCIVLMYQFNNPIMIRLIDTISGNDSSNWYRISVSLKVLKQSFIDYNGFGFGFGNLGTGLFSSKYYYLGVAKVVSNSFQYFIIEAGVFGIISLVILWYKLIKGVFKNHSYIKISILVFLFLYQIFGGHFTSGLTWALYGLCLSEFNEKSELEG